MRVRRKAVGGTAKPDVTCREARGFGRAGDEFDRAERRCASLAPGSRVRGRKSFVQKRRMAGRGSCSRVCVVGRCVRVRAPWRALVDRIESLKSCHESTAESRAALTAW